MSWHAVKPNQPTNQPTNIETEITKKKQKNSSHGIQWD